MPAKSTVTMVAGGATTPGMETKEYYSTIPNLTMCVSTPRKDDPTKYDTRIAQFVPMAQGSGSGGRFTTSDPVIINYLETRRAEAAELGRVCDVMDHAEWIEAVMPVEIKLREARARIEALERQLTERNPLIELVASDKPVDPDKELAELNRMLDEADGGGGSQHTGTTSTATAKRGKK